MVQKKRRCKHKMIVEFEAQADAEILEDESIYSGSIASPMGTSDMVTIGSNFIEFAFERSKWLPQDKVAENRVRNDQFQAAMLYIHTQVAMVPKISKIVLIEEKRKPLNVTLPAPMRNSYCGKTRVGLSPRSAQLILGQSEKSKAIKIALSYICASDAASDSQSRFRYLWTSFNALAIYLVKRDRPSDIPSTRKVQDDQALEKAADHLLCCCDTHALLDRYERLGGFGFFSKLDLYTFLVNAKNCKGNMSGYLQKMIPKLDINAYQKLDEVCRAAKIEFGKNEKGKELSHFRPACEDSLERQAVFVVCAYLYGMRNALFHGSAMHPIYSTRKGTDLHGLCDLLEEACVTIIESLASGVAEA